MPASCLHHACIMPASRLLLLPLRLLPTWFLLLLLLLLLGTLQAQVPSCHLGQGYLT
jgi:hypothetical protein